MLQRLWQLIGELLFPPHCGGCQQPGEWLCSTCREAIVRFSLPRCARCDLPLDPYDTSSPSCSTCRHTCSSLDGLRVVGPYEEPLRSAIHALKYRSQRRVAVPLGSLLSQRWMEAPSPSIDGIVPVPLHETRHAERGFNQSQLLAEVLAADLGCEVRVDILWRTHPTRPQVGLTWKERLHNVSGAFHAAPDAAGRRWLLVDDVCTSGATLEASAMAMREQGGTSIWAITLARPYRQSSHLQGIFLD